MVTQHHFQLRSAPREESCQRVLAHIVDHLTQITIRVGEDCFGNPIYYGVMAYPHDMFVAVSHGVVECDPYRVEESLKTPIYRMESRMTHCSEQMLQFAEEVMPKEGSAVERALEVSEAIYNRLSYQAGVTTTETTAAESFSIMSGVCQDFAHILIAICRNYAIFARYCVGFLVGTGETHAWAEIYDEAQGVWYGIDPTHNRLIEYDYIKIAHGRDASDCSVIRGVHRGDAGHTTQIRVMVEPLY